MKDTQNYVPLNSYLHYANQFKINNLRKNLSLAIIDFVTKKNSIDCFCFKYLGEQEASRSLSLRFKQDFDS